MKGCELLILADDFTGALDTAASLAREGVPVTAVTDRDILPGEADSPALVIDTESRHLSAEEAYWIYEGLCRRWGATARQVYIKTDSVLRGNLSSYLAGAIDGLPDHPAAYFLPAFPEAGRTTVGGRQYLNGVPIEETPFARDPLNPVTGSRIRHLVSCPYRAKVTEVPTNAGLPIWESGIGRRIAVFDGESREQLEARGRQLRSGGLLRLTAGCAGFAGCFPGLLGLASPQGRKRPPAVSGLLALCGSANEITFRQLERGAAAGWRLITPQREALLGGYPERAAGQLKKALQEDGRALLAISRNREEVESFTAFCQEQGMSGEEIHRVIQRYLERAAQLLFAEDGSEALVVFGGDTLFSVLKALGGSRLTVIGEAEPGVPVSLVSLRGRERVLVSKSGGLGSEAVLQNIEAYFYR